MKKAATIFISAVMTLSLGVNAFADVISYNINTIDHNIEIGEEGNSNTYVVTGTGLPTSHRIIVSGATSTTITLDNVHIVTTNGEDAIDIGDDADVALVIEGANTLTATNANDVAGIHISGGSITISGTDAGADILNVNTGYYSAAIGSINEEDFSGTITINDGVTVNANSAHGAAIGSGSSGEMSGDITINGGTVNATSTYAAGIGSGILGGNMNGDITINGGRVNATSEYEGAGIGSGFRSEVNGNITINGGDVTATTKGFGSGIGSGAWEDMNGNITINGGNVIAEAKKDGAAIGQGLGGSEILYDMSGQININGGNVTATSATGEVGIGAGIGNIASGDITIQGDADITLGENNAIGAKEESEGSIYLYKGAEINGITVENAEELKEAGILNDNMNVEFIGAEETNSGHSYSLNKSNNVSRIKSAKAGDTVYVYESQLSKGKVPYYVLEELAKMDDVTLVVVSDSGETVEIKSSNIPEKGKNAFFTVDELLEMEK